MATEAQFLDPGGSPAIKHHHDADGAEEDLLAAPISPTTATATAITGGKKAKRKRDTTAQLRKAPQAPKRFKSSYICFFMAKQTEIKEELGDKATVTAISKRSAEMWKTLPKDERAHWDDVAAKDKQRYMVEKATYTGPWQVPWKRAKKDPSAPKRPMSAFLYFAQGRRSTIKGKNPDMKNTEVSRILGEMWRNSSDDERRPHVEKEKVEREKYKIAVAKWREEYEAKMEEERKIQAENTAAAVAAAAAAAAASAEPQQQIPTQQQVPMGFPEQFANQMAGQPAAFPMYGQFAPTPYQFPAAVLQYQFPTDGKAVVLGPTGQPHSYPMSPGSQQQQRTDQPTLAPQQQQQQNQYGPPLPGTYEENPTSSYD